MVYLILSRFTANENEKPYLDDIPAGCLLYSAPNEQRSNDRPTIKYNN